MSGTIDEGYVKYDSRWQEGPPPDADAVRELDAWRRPLFEAGLIGHYAEHDVGYGNLSVRTAAGFVISATQTGHLKHTTGAHYALVTDVDIAANRVTSIGPLPPSSESMTHAALYALSPAICAVVHVHSRKLWRRHVDTLPTTASSVAYGTPDMAREFARLWHRTAFADVRIAVMAGHEDGLVSVGPTLEDAAARLLKLR